MGFETALLKLVGAGLTAVGSAAHGLVPSQAAVEAGLDLIQQASARGEGRRIAGLVEGAAHELLPAYRQSPERIERSVAGVTRLLALVSPTTPEVMAALSSEAAAADADLIGLDDEAADGASPIAEAILKDAGKLGALEEAGVEAAAARGVLVPLLRLVLSDRGLIELLGPLLRSHVERHEAAEADGDPFGERELEDRLRPFEPTLAKIAQEHTVPMMALREVARRLTQFEIPEAQLEGRLHVKALEYREFEQRITRLSQLDPAVGTLRAQAAHAVGAGRYDLADRLLAQAEEIDLAAARVQHDASSQRLLSASDTRGERGAIEDLRFNYRKAAAHFAAAAAYVPVEDNRARWWRLMQQATALGRLAEELGEPGALEEALALHPLCIGLAPSQGGVKDRALTQSLFGGLMLRMGEREPGVDRLKEAARLSREAADELVGRREPARWAKSMTDCANALYRIGERTRDAAQLADAASAFRETIAVYSRESSPEDWALAQVAIANVMSAQAAVEGNPRRILAAIEAYKTALEALSPARAPIEWAKAHLSFANALLSLGRETGDLGRVQQAEASYQAALTVLSRNRNPHYWAMAQTNLGSLHILVGRDQKQRLHFDRAVQAYRAAAEVYGSAGMQEELAATQAGLASAFEHLAELEDSATASLTAAVSAYRAVLSVIDPEADLGRWARCELDLGRVLFLLGAETKSARYISEALVVDQAALEALERIGEQDLAAMVRDGLAEKQAYFETMRPGIAVMS